MVQQEILGVCMHAGVCECVCVCLFGNSENIKLQDILYHLKSVNQFSIRPHLYVAQHLCIIQSSV